MSALRPRSRSETHDVSDQVAPQGREPRHLRCRPFRPAALTGKRLRAAGGGIARADKAGGKTRDGRRIRGRPRTHPAQ
jgi:hypothetical protein